MPPYGIYATASASTSIGADSAAFALSQCTGQQAFEFFGGRVVHQLFKDPLEVGERIGSMGADLFDPAPAGCRSPRCSMTGSCPWWGAKKCGTPGAHRI